VAEHQIVEADHVNKFRDPRMRAILFEISDESTEGFKPMVVAALKKISRPEKVTLET